MRCPKCNHPDTRVSDSRPVGDGAMIRRRRECPECEERFTTLEQFQVMVLKSNGASEPFSRDKVIAGVRKACTGCNVSEAQLAHLGEQVEKTIRATTKAEIPSDEVGLATLDPLRQISEVAYLRFASVYKHFQSVDDFLTEIASLKQSETSPDQ